LEGELVGGVEDVGRVGRGSFDRLNGGFSVLEFWGEFTGGGIWIFLGGRGGKGTPLLSDGWLLSGFMVTL